MQQTFTKSRVHAFIQRHKHLAHLGAAVAALLSGCATGPARPPETPAPAPVQPVLVAPPAPAPEPIASGGRSDASTPREYRRDAAQHLYAKNAERIFIGKMPPLLYAVGVLQVDIDNTGQVTDVRWMRAPRQAPEVMAEIEQMVRAAAPFPAPLRMGQVTYTDTWLWHKSGRFQLDTLTEGQN